jgi:hypothetical protein
MAQPRDPALNPSAAPLASLGIRHRSCWVLLAPGVWADWISVLTEASRQGFGVPLSSRLLLVVVLVWLGARRDWPSLLVVASMLALPILWDAHGRPWCWESPGGSGGHSMRAGSGASKADRRRVANAAVVADDHGCKSADLVNLNRRSPLRFRRASTRTTLPKWTPPPVGDDRVESRCSGQEPQSGRCSSLAFSGQQWHGTGVLWTH